MPLPILPGSRGEDVRDLHQRLAAAGFPPSCHSADIFDDGTATSVRSFQTARGLPITGTCDGPTWQQLIEAGFRLGDRLLYRHSPMLRGDDVAELQLRLGSLGFDAGRIDGIFGPDTERALIDFQRNVGLPTDGVAGTDSVRELLRVGAKSDQGHPVASVRERDRLRRAPRSLVDRRVVVGEFGGSAALVLATARPLRVLGASVTTLHHPNASRQAQDANNHDAELFLAIETVADHACTALYFATTGYVSTGGKRLAEMLIEDLAPLMKSPAQAVGNRTPVLRETRMPAVQIQLGPAALVSASLAAIATALTHSLERWFVEPLDEGKSLAEDRPKP